MKSITRESHNEKLAVAGFAASLAIVLVLSFAAYRMSENQLDADRLVAHTHEVLSSLASIRASLTDVENGQLGYAIVGKESYLKPYDEGTAELAAHLRELRALVADNPRQQGRIDELEKALAPRLASMAESIEARRARGAAAAQRLADSDIPRQQTDRLRGILRELEQEEDRLLKMRQREQAAAIQNFWLSMAALVAVLTVTLAVLYARIRRVYAQARRLQSSEVSARLLAENVIDYAIIMLDAKGHVASWGAGAQRFKGYRAEEIIGRHFSVFYPPEDIEAGKPQSKLEEAAANDRIEDEGWRVRKDGSRFWANVVITAIRDESGALRGFGKVTRDMTGPRRTEEALHREVEERRKLDEELKALNLSLERRVAEGVAELGDTRQRLAGIIDSAMDAIITIDDAQRILLFNAAAEDLFGCPQAEAVGAPLTWFIPKRYREGHAAHVERFGKTGVTSRKMGEQRIVMGLRRNGEEFPIEASISQIEQKGRKYYTVILRDVTERVLAEEKLRESKEELHELASSGQAAREEEKARIARELHDELGQLMTALKMDLGAMKAQARARAPEDAGRIKEMEALLDSMVTATRRIAADLRPMMLDDLGLVPAAEWLVEDFRKRTGVECSLRVVPHDLEVQDAHATAIYRMLQESLTNVAKHAKAAFVDVSIEAGAKGIDLMIRDNGRGFHTGDARKPLSFGLVGLRERAYFLGGTVAIESEPGRGTTVRARIPLAGAPARGPV